jgi:plasmid rolling circle replication initiator protein Rep
VLLIAQNRSETGLKLASRLESIVPIENSPRAALNVKKLKLCADPKNIYFAADLHNRETGECFDGVGQLWACRLPYCPNCNARAAGRHRARVREALTQIKPRVGLKWQFVTLTAPSVNVPLFDSIATFLRAWNLFRKRKFWVKSAWAGWKGVEFTVNSGSGLNHVHIHALALAKFLRADDVRRVWSDCIAAACWEKDVFLRFKTSHGGAVVHIDEIKSKRGSAMEKAILEVAKYVCKPDAWLSVSPSDLLAVTQCERFPRLFESFGKAYALGAKHHLDTKHLTDGENHKLKSPKSPNEIGTLTQKVATARLWRKAQLLGMFRAADFQTLDGRDF